MAHIIHECFYCNRRYAAATSLAASFARPADRLAPRDLDILFQVCLGLSGLRVPVSPGVLAVSSRTVMNNVGSLLFKPMVTKAFRADGFYERFPAKGQLERVRKIHQRLLDAIVG